MVIHICLTRPNTAFRTVLDDIYQERQRDSSLLREVSDKMVCLACRCTFTNREDQVFPGFVLNPFLNAMHGCWHRHLGNFFFFGMLDGTLQARLASFQFETKDVGSITGLRRRV